MCGWSLEVEQKSLLACQPALSLSQHWHPHCICWTMRNDNRHFQEVVLDPIIARFKGIVFSNRITFGRIQKWIWPTPNSVRQIRLPKLERRRGHRAAFICSCISSCFSASRNDGRTQMNGWRRLQTRWWMNLWWRNHCSNKIFCLTTLQKETIPKEQMNFSILQIIRRLKSPNTIRW